MAHHQSVRWGSELVVHAIQFESGGPVTGQPMIPNDLSLHAIEHPRHARVAVGTASASRPRSDLSAPTTADAGESLWCAAIAPP
jgi:hypothetical protein